jgi:uncharacterized RDD family membrane protein YckC
MPLESPREAPPLHAGFWRRVSAGLVDAIVAYLVAIPLLVVTAVVASVATAERFFIPAIALYVLLCVWAGALMHATPGQRAFGIALRTTEGRFASPLQALVRTLVLVSTLGLGLLAAAVTPRKQGLHDLAAGTLVVRRTATAEEVREGSGTMRIGPAVALVIVAVLALPFAAAVFTEKIRDNYVQRARLSEIGAAVKPLQRQVDAARAAGAALPGGPAAIDARFAKSARFGDEGAIVVEVADRIAPGGRVSFTRDGAQWKCEAHGIPAGYLPRDCRD